MPKGKTDHAAVPIAWDDEGPTDSASRMLAAMKPNEIVTIAEVVKRTGYEKSCVSRTLRKLTDEGKVRSGTQIIRSKRTAVFKLR